MAEPNHCSGFEKLTEYMGNKFDLEITGNCRGSKRKSYDVNFQDLIKPLPKRHRQ